MYVHTADLSTVEHNTAGYRLLETRKGTPKLIGSRFELVEFKVAIRCG
jgi:hypothetical protein